MSLEDSRNISKYQQSLDMREFWLSLLLQRHIIRIATGHIKMFPHNTECLMLLISHMAVLGTDENVRRSKCNQGRRRW
ncbi:hypothetical protein Mapa_017483 [Marchantia paleacea]|nr:hypothetical protein Mapa_017483 [Marchantia paleacea]